MDELYTILKTTPTEPPFNIKISETLSKNISKTYLEYALYLYVVHNGDMQEIEGKTFWATKLTIKDICELFGVQKSKAYYAVNNLIFWKILMKTNKNYILTGMVDAKRVLDFSATVENEPTQEDENSITMEKLQHKNSTTAENSTTVETESEQGKRSNAAPSNDLDGRDKDKIEEDPHVVIRSITTTNGNILPYSSTTMVDAREASSVPKNPFEKLESGKRRDGYYASDYAKGGEKYGKRGYKPAQRLIQWFMRRLYEQNEVDYFFPKSKYPKYCKLLMYRLQEVGDEKGTKAMIDWYVSCERYRSAGWSLDLFLDSSTLNAYNSADSTESGKGRSSGMVLTDEERKSAKGIII